MLGHGLKKLAMNTKLAEIERNIKLFKKKVMKNIYAEIMIYEVDLEPVS
jgi:hypothetical protein